MFRDASEPRQAATPQSSRPSGRSPRPPPPIPDYELLKCIGVGSYGEVWLGRSVMGAWRAVKVVYRGHFDDDRPFEREFAGIQKFEPISRLHRSQVDILHVGKNDAEGYFYYVMELADSADDEREKGGKGAGKNGALSPSHLFSPASYAPRTLRSDLQRYVHLPLEECLNIALTLTAALEYLHAHGLVHRDVKPSNIIFVGGQPKLADIGLVTGVDATRSFVGTEGYIPPEGPGTPQADLFSLGRTLYEVSTGKHREDFPEPPTRWQGDPEGTSWREFHEVVLKACEPDTKRRYQSAQQMRADLALLQAGKSVKRLRNIERQFTRLKQVSAVGIGLMLLVAAAYVGSLRQARIAAANARQEQQQRQLAEQAGRQAQEANTRLTEALSRLEIQKAEDLLADEETPTALAYLARLLRQQPTNQVVGQRIVSALSHRRMALPVTGPIPHPDQVHRAEFSPDDQYLITWASDRKTRLWDAQTGESLKNASPSELPVKLAAFNRRGHRMFVASSNEVRALNLPPDGAESLPIRLHGTIIRLQFLAGEESFVTLTLDGTTQLWDAQTGQAKSPARRLQAQRDTAPIRYSSLSADAKKVATVHSNYVAYLWDADTGQVLTPPLPFHFDGTSMASVRFTPDNKKILVLSSLEMAQIRSAETGQPIGDALRHQTKIRAAEFSPDSQRVITCSDDHTARIWDATTGQPLGEPLRHKSWVYGVGWSPDGQRVVTCSADRTARVWDGFTGEPLSEPLRHNNAVRYASFSHDGRRLVTGSEDRTARVWDISPGCALSATMHHRNGFVVESRFSPEGRKVVSASSDKTARLWDSRTGQLLSPPLVHEEQVRRVVFNSDGRLLVTAAADGYIRFWDSDTGRLLRHPLKEAGAVWSFKFSPDEERFVTATLASVARVWDSRTFQPITPPLRHDDTWVNSAEFSPDGRRIVTTSRDRTARVWDAQTGQQLLLLRHEREVNRAVFSPDGEWIATAEGNWGGTGSSDGAARLWNSRTGQLRFAPLHHKARVPVVRFSPEGKKLLTASDDGTARLWDAQSGKPLTEPMEHPQQVSCAAFSPDGGRFVTGCNDSGVRLWDALSGERVAEVFRHTSGDYSYGITSAEFSPDGRWLVSSCLNGAVQVWDVAPLPQSIPRWLADLAEAVAGQHFVEDGSTEPVDWAEVQKLKTPLLESASSDAYTRWAKWFFADRSTRTISPNSPVTVPEYVQRRVEENTLESLREAIRLSPTNALAFARLAQVLSRDPTRNPRKVGEAEWLSSHAVMLAPADAEVLRTRQEVERLACESRRP